MIERFLFIEKEEWPKEMEVMLDNMLRTTLFDVDLSKNSGNNTDVLDCVAESLKRQFPSKLDDMRKEHISEEDIFSSELRSTPQASFHVAAPVSQRAINHVQLMKSSDDFEMRSVDEKLKFLQLHHICCHRMTWQSYWKELSLD